MSRIGMSFELGSDVGVDREFVADLVAAGYTDLWSSETSGSDAFTPLALGTGWGAGLRLGTAVCSVFTRGPGVLAQSAASLANAAPGRFVIGLGSSSSVIVERWNARHFVRPLSRTRDTVAFLRAALAGERVQESYDTFAVEGFRLQHPPVEVPPIFIAALREGMLRLAGEEADGVILNWLSAQDVSRAVEVVRRAGRPCEVVARLFVCPSEDAEAVRAAARQFLAAYLTVPVYRKYHEWLGRDEELRPLQDLWAGGRRAEAAAAIPDEVIDDLIVHGSAADCARHIRRYVENGVDTAVVAVMPWGISREEGARRLAPEVPGLSSPAPPGPG